MLDHFEWRKWKKSFKNIFKYNQHGLVTIQSYNGPKEGDLQPAEDVGPSLWSRDQNLGTWQHSHIYSHL